MSVLRWARQHAANYPAIHTALQQRRLLNAPAPAAEAAVALLPLGHLHLQRV